MHTIGATHMGDQCPMRAHMRTWLRSFCKIEKNLVGIHCMVVNAREIDNTFLFRWDDWPSAKLDDLSWRQCLDTLQASFAAYQDFVAPLRNYDGPRYHRWKCFRGPALPSHCRLACANIVDSSDVDVWISTRWDMTPASSAQKPCHDHIVKIICTSL